VVDASGAVIGGAGVLGLIFGSFGTVAAYRIPQRESIVAGRSKCPHCGRTITAAENIPVISYLLQRGRCRGCGEPISVRYPLVELATAVLFGLAVWKFELSGEAVLFAAFFWVLVVLTVIDLEHRLLPDRINYPALAIAWAGLIVLALIESRTDLLMDAALGAIVFGGFLFLCAFIYPAGMGGGDVKLGFLLGTFLGYQGGVGLVLTGMFLSFLIGALFGVGAMLVQRAGRKTMVPFGPFLAIGTIVTILWGQGLLDWYLRRL
jgi:leader peptidase (prepilin peptidase) / N-methyltransferase